MKFENIKPGDKVLIPVTVPYGWRGGKDFLIEKDVSRTTKTLFVIKSEGKDLKFQKKSGRKVGGSFFENARHIGEEYYDLGRKYTATDQTKEMMEFQQKVKTVSKLNHEIRNLRRFSVDDFKTLTELRPLVNAVRILTKIQEEK